MSDLLAVLLHDRAIGHLEQRQGRLRFTYLGEHQQARGATPLSLSMPLATQVHDDAVVRPWLWGLLPDNEHVLRHWGRTFGVSARNPFALLRQVGRDCPGAVQLVDEDVDDPRPDRIVWLDEEAIADRIRALAEDEAAWLGRTAGGEFSLAGAQPKFALLEQDGVWGRPEGRVATTHIFKPAVRAGLADLDLCEHLCLEALRTLGLPTAQSRLLAFDGATALVVTRFDRVVREGRVLRVHQEDLCQALGRGPEAKYQSEGGPTPSEIVELLRRRVHPPAQAERSVQSFVDALLASWLLAGTDAHAKNYAVLLSGGEVRLAPLYDVLSLIPFERDLHRAKLAMRIGGEYRLLRIAQRHWRRAAMELGLDEDAVVARGRELAERLPRALTEAAGREEVLALGSDLPGRLVEGVREHAERCARSLRFSAAGR